MTGISDALQNSPELLKCTTQIFYNLKDEDEGESVPPLPECPDPRPSILLNDCKNIKSINREPPSATVSNYKWAVLYPVTSRGSSSEMTAKNQLQSSARVFGTIYSNGSTCKNHHFLWI